ncbi:histone H1.10-like [Hyperolius riggenbachi]|uniref:histone H1.10-like n=1 Tax=Hyperolius riggenbachi TaxID=752182 RepID=UPI0035A3A662
MSLELEENVPSTEEEEDEEAPSDKKRSSSRKKTAAAAPSSGSKKKSKKKKNQPGKYSQLVVDTIRKLGERNGSSLAKIYSEAKKVSWFDQQNGRTYLKYSVKALVQNDTLLQVKGVGANGSFRLNKKKLEGGTPEKAPSPKPAAKKAPPKKSPSKTKAKPEPKKEAKKSSPKAVAKSAKKKKNAAATGGGKKVKKAGKPKGHKSRKA